MPVLLTALHAHRPRGRTQPTVTLTASQECPPGLRDQRRPRPPSVSLHLQALGHLRRWRPGRGQDCAQGPSLAPTSTPAPRPRNQAAGLSPSHPSQKGRTRVPLVTGVSAPTRQGREARVAREESPCSEEERLLAALFLQHFYNFKVVLLFFN